MLLVIKFLILLGILCASTLVGYIISNKYLRRVKELQDIVTSLELFETKINYTYDTIPDCFKSISEYIGGYVGKIFKETALCLERQNDVSTGDCLKNVLDNERVFLSINDVDIEILKGLSVSLGQIDLDSQIKNIRLVIHTLNSQLEQAKEEKSKNFKLYRNMGVLAGLVLMIVLI